MCPAVRHTAGPRAARPPACCVWVSRIGTTSSQVSASICVFIKTSWLGLLTSCATPATRVPSAVSLLAWISCSSCCRVCSSRRLRAVRSRNIPVT